MRMQDIVRLQEEFDRLFRDARAWVRSPAAGPSFVPLTDVCRSAESYVVRCDLPGVAAEDLRVYAEDGVISISGKQHRTPAPAGKLLRGERQFGHFSRLVPLPSDADLDAVNASLESGVLQIRIGRLKSREARRVQVQVG